MFSLVHKHYSCFEIVQKYEWEPDQIYKKVSSSKHFKI